MEGKYLSFGGKNKGTAPNMLVVQLHRYFVLATRHGEELDTKDSGLDWKYESFE